MRRSTRRKKNFIVSSRRTTSTRSSTSSWTVFEAKLGSSWSSWEKSQWNWRIRAISGVLHSTQLQEEDWSKIKILSLNSLARYRNCKMKLIVWMIQNIFKMLNQYAVGPIPTLPVNLCLSHLIQFLGGMLSRSIGMPRSREGPPSIWDTHGISGNVFANSSRVFFSTLSAGIESMEFSYVGTNSLLTGGEEWESNTGSEIWDASPDRQPKIHSSLVRETL